MARRCAALAAVGTVIVLLAMGGPATAAPSTSAPPCAAGAVPPPPVDASEVPPPGQPAPAPLPMPAVPVGGTRMAECGVVLPPGAPPPPPTATAASWLVADLDSGAVLAARDPHARHRPASLIKVLTALVVLRTLDPDAAVVATEEDARQQGSRVGLGTGGQYTVRQLLAGMLLNSGNDAAHALAGQLGGQPQAVAEMTALAGRLGALDTRPATPSGLDGPGMSSSAYDMALLFRVAMREPLFAKTVATRLLDFPGWGGRPGFQVSNDNKLLANYPGALGGKTGFTDDARHTYAGAAQRDGRRLVVVLMRGEQAPVPMWRQAGQLLDYGFALAAAGTPPVGTLVESAPAPPPPPPPAAAPAPPATERAALPYLTSAAAATLVALAALGTAVLRRRARTLTPP